MNPRILSLVLSVGLLLSACGGVLQAPPAQPQATPAQATDTPEPTPMPTPSSTPIPIPTETPLPVASSIEPLFEETPCPFMLPPDEIEGETVQCGFVVVPEDRSQPESPTIRLAVVVFKATGDDPQADPVILLSGGPGEKTVASAVTAAIILASFRDRRDVIVFDQRGVGLSEPALECPEMVQASYDLVSELDPETALRTMYTAILACRDRLVQEGHNLAAYNTTENATDVDDIRAALGYEQLNIYGGSYGSLLAQAVMRDHPEGLRSVIMGAVLPAEKSLFVNMAMTRVDAVMDLLRACAADEACNAAYPNLEQVLYDTVEKLNADPVPITVTNPLDGQAYDTWLTGDDVVNNLMIFLHFTDIIPVLPQAVFDVANGDYELMVQLVSTQFQLFDLLSRGMEFSVLCAEDLIGVTPQDYLAERAKVPAALQGRIDPEVAIEYDFFGICQGWPVPQADPRVKEPVKSDVPTLILEGEFDPVTPLAYAEAVARHLSNSQVYEFPGVGHNVLVAAPCARQIARDFLEDPSAEPDATCLAEMPGVVFDLPKEPAAGVALEPVVFLESGLSAVKPDGWEEVAPGTYRRGQNALDPIALIYDAAPVSEVEFLQAIQAQIKLTEAPESTGVRATESFTWTLYSTVVRGVVLDMAMTSWKDQTLLVLMQAKADERDSLYEPLFLAAVDAVKPVD